MFSFIKSFVGVKGQQLGQDIVNAIVEIDPESATQAQLDEMEKDLDKAGAVIQKLRADYEREVREADAATRRYNEMLAAAELLQAKIDAPATADRAGLEASLAKLIGQLEQFAPEVEQEKKDVDEVKALLDDAQSAYRAKAEALTAAKGNLERAKRDMQRAVMEQERADEKAKRAAEVAGLRQGPSSKLNVAVDAMQRRADEARAKTDAAKLKAETLTTLSAPNGDDPHIAEAMRQVKGGAAQTGSLSDRLAKLKRP
ncbi:PspA/IM30 family protein [Azospirillaceae bacterium]